MLRRQRTLAAFSRLDTTQCDGAGGLQAQIKHGLQLKGERVVIAGSGPLLLAVASTVKRAGGNIVAIIEQAPITALARFATGLWRWPEKLRQFGELFPARYHPASQVIQAQGDTCLQSVTVRHQGQTREIACDRLAIGYGLVPNIEPGAIFGCKTENQAIWVDADQRTSVQDIYAAGECTGFGGSELALAEEKLPAMPPQIVRKRPKAPSPRAPAGSVLPRRCIRRLRCRSR